VGLERVVERESIKFGTVSVVKTVVTTRARPTQSSARRRARQYCGHAKLVLIFH
jgi:hypothetical protein